MFAAAGAADATTYVYVGSRAPDAGTVELSITTDGTLGTLTNAHVIDWSASLSLYGDTVELFGPQGGGNSTLDISGLALQATSTALLFDFNGALGSFLRIRSTSGTSLYCAETSGCFEDQRGESIAVNGSSEREGRAGVQEIAHVQAPAVPEPATWAMMIAGFGAVGSAMRRAKRQAPLVA